MTEISNWLNKQIWLVDPRVQRTASGLFHEATLQNCQGPGLFHLSSCYPGASSQGWQLSHHKMTATAQYSHKLPQACLSRGRDSLTSYSSFLRARMLFHPNPQQACPNTSLAQTDLNLPTTDHPWQRGGVPDWLMPAVL